MKSVIAGSAIVGVALIVASFINSGAVSFKDEHVIPVTGGAVKLGDVYSEHQIVSLKMVFGNKDFSDEDLLQDANVGDYKDALKNKLNSLSDLINTGKKDKDKITGEGLSVKNPAKLEVTTAVRYRSEYQPSFTLVLGKKTFDLPTNESIYQKSIDSVDAFLKEQQYQFNSALYLK